MPNIPDLSCLMGEDKKAGDNARDILAIRDLPAVRDAAVAREGGDRRMNDAVFPAIVSRPRVGPMPRFMGSRAQAFRSAPRMMGGFRGRFGGGRSSEHLRSNQNFLHRSNEQRNANIGPR